MYARLDTIPASLAPAKQARHATYRADSLIDWIAEVDVLPEGATEITPEQYIALLGEIEVHNGNLPEPPAPEPQPDPQAALLEALADEWERAAAELRAGRPSQAAEALDRAAEVARGAAR